MSRIFLTALLLAAPAGVQSPSAAETRTLSLSITDEKGPALLGLAPEDVALLENGVARDIVSFAPDERPLTVAVLVDTSEAVRTAYRLNVVAAVTGFLAGLPSGSRFAVWTVGERPTKRVDYTDDVKVAEQSLQRIAPAGGSTLLDALLEATKDLRKKEGERNAVVVLSAVGPEFSSAYRERVVSEAPGPDTTFFSLMVEEGATDIENRNNYDYVLERLAKKSGGMFEVTLSPMSLDKEMQKLLGGLKGQYRLTYATVPELKQRKLEVKVARPKAQTRLAPLGDAK